MFPNEDVVFHVSRKIFVLGLKISIATKQSTTPIGVFPTQKSFS